MKKSIDSYVATNEIASALMQASFINLACAFAAVDAAAAIRALKHAETFAFRAAVRVADAMPGSIDRDALDETVGRVQHMIKLAQEELRASCDERRDEVADEC